MSPYDASVRPPGRGKRRAVRLLLILSSVLAFLSVFAIWVERQVAGEASDKVLQSSTAQNLWKDANRAAHEQLVQVLEGGGPTVSTRRGVVKLNLGSLLNSLASQVGLGKKVDIPADAAQITI